MAKITQSLSSGLLLSGANSLRALQSGWRRAQQGCYTAGEQCCPQCGERSGEGEGGRGKGREEVGREMGRETRGKEEEKRDKEKEEQAAL